MFFNVEIFQIHIKTRPTRYYQILQHGPLVRSSYFSGEGTPPCHSLQCAQCPIGEATRLNRRIQEPSLWCFFTNLGSKKQLLVLLKISRISKVHKIPSCIPSLIYFINMHHYYSTYTTVVFWFQDLRLKDVGGQDGIGAS